MVGRGKKHALLSRPKLVEGVEVIRLVLLRFLSGQLFSALIQKSLGCFRHFCTAEMLLNLSGHLIYFNCLTLSGRPSRAKLNELPIIVCTGG